MFVFTILKRTLYFCILKLHHVTFINNMLFTCFLKLSLYPDSFFCEKKSTPLLSPRGPTAIYRSSLSETNQSEEESLTAVRQMYKKHIVYKSYKLQLQALHQTSNKSVLHLHFLVIIWTICNLLHTKIIKCAKRIKTFPMKSCMCTLIVE